MSGHLEPTVRALRLPQLGPPVARSADPETWFTSSWPAAESEPGVALASSKTCEQTSGTPNRIVGGMAALSLCSRVLGEDAIVLREQGVAVVRVVVGERRAE